MSAPGTALMGDIAMYGFQFAPYQWTHCAGQLIAISQNQALYSLVGTFYGGDGRVTMGMPSLSSRSPAGFNMGNQQNRTPYNIGVMYGFEWITLTQSQLPAHDHAAIFTPSGGTGATGSLKVLNTAAGTSTPATAGWISGGNAIAFSDTKLPFQQEVEISGLTVSGGGGISGTVTLGDTGGDPNTGDTNHHYNMAPFQAVNFSICEFGLYPQRN